MYQTRRNLISAEQQASLNARLYNSRQLLPAASRERLEEAQHTATEMVNVRDRRDDDFFERVDGATTAG